MRILVVDDEEIKRVSLVDDLSAAEHEPVGAASGEEALELLGRERFDVVLTDLRMPGLDGMDLLRQIKLGDGPRPEVILMTAYGSIPIAVEAMKVGALDFVTKPFRNRTILPLLSRIESQLRGPTSEATGATDSSAVVEQRFVGTAPAIRVVRGMMEVCARSDATVLLTGETGTGKDVVAGMIHELSSRRAKRFVKVNCAALPGHLIESELYGYEKGAFTGADQFKKGKIDLAQGGTVYLDDVDDIPMKLQVKLLSLIEEKVFERVGGSAPVDADVRIIAATKQDLLAKVSDGSFRSDLYYRLNVLRIDLPPLRQHPDDLAVLVEHLLGSIDASDKCRLADGVLELLGSHTWPGNVRELAHTLGRVSLAGDGTITAELLATDLARSQQSPGVGGAFSETIRQTEREMLADALADADGNKSAAARALGMKLSTFRDKLAKHHLA